MDRERAETLLARLGRRVGGGVLMWRGAELDGADLDLLVLAGAEGALAATLRADGLRPAAGDPGHSVWRSPDGSDLEVDVLRWSAWPAYYPSLAGIVERSGQPGTPLPVAAPEDRLLMLAAEAVAGRPLAKVASRARRLLADHTTRERLAALGRSEGMTALAALVLEPDRLERRGRRGRLSYAQALVLARGSPAARAALRSRLLARLRATGAWQGAKSARDARRRRTGLLVTVSGMDGSGKSTLAATLSDQLLADGRPTEAVWSRFGGDTEVLDRVAGVAKRILRRRGTIADPVAAGGRGRSELKAGPRRADRADPPPPPRRGPTAWAWVTFVAALAGRRLRAAARRRRGGTTVICDRWVADAVVDMELRYGRHRLAELAMSLAAPRPDLALLLVVDHRTAFERNSEDQAGWVLDRMERGYADAAKRWGLTPIGASRDASLVASEAGALLEALVLERWGAGDATQRPETAPPASSPGS